LGLHVVQSDFLNASDGRLGVMLAEGVNQFASYPAHTSSTGELMQAVFRVPDVRAAVEEMRSRGVEFEEYETAEIHTNDGIALTPDGREGAWFKDSEGNLIGIVTALGG
jgi:hypothetical protein